MAKIVKKINPVQQQIVQKLQPQKRVCAYCRVSTDSDAQHNSFSAQTEYYKTFIESREGWEFAGIYADEARSGTKLQKRDDFIRMMDDCENGRIDMIITKSITRFARNTVDSIQALRRLNKLGIAVFFEKENINSLSEKSELLLTILSSVAQGEAESTSANNKWAIVKRFADGTYILSCTAYGYTKDENGELIIVQEEAEIVKRIFRAYLNGVGGYTIAKELNEEGIPTIRSAEQWDDKTVLGILQNPIYAGNLLLQKTFTTEVLPFRRKNNRGQVPKYFIRDNHEPIVTEEDTKAVKKIMRYRKRQYQLDPVKCLNRYDFSSKIICGECGNTFRRQKIYIGKPYEAVQWSCSQHIENIDICGQKAVRDDMIKEVFVRMWNKLTSNNSEILLPLLLGLKTLRIDEQQEKEIEDCSNKIMELLQQGHILSRLIAKGYMDPADFIERRNALKLELEAMKRKRTQLLDRNGFEKEINGTEALLELTRNHPAPVEEYREDLFLQAVDKVIIKGERITFLLINRLELTEIIRKEERRNGPEAHAHRLSDCRG